MENGSSKSKPGSNWAAMKSSVSASSTKPKKKPATGSGASKAAFAKSAPKPKPKPAAKPALKAPPIQPQTSDPKGKGKEEDVGELSAMIRGEIDAHAVGHSKPGLYLALDCEMVGVGPVNQTRMGSRASESSLARVSIVNFHGVVMLDCYVKQREKVTDYRTQWSGVRAEDLVGSSARPFVEVQKNVAGLLKDRVLVGHAVANDLKALLLAHPFPLTRDTQSCAAIRKKYNTTKTALRNLVKSEFGVNIQEGEHSSIIDARATMALFRLFKPEWDKTLSPKARHAMSGLGELGTGAQSKRKRIATAESEDVNSGDDHRPAKRRKEGAKEGAEYPGGGRKGISSGLSVVIKGRAGNNRDGRGATSAESSDASWWTNLDGPSIGHRSARSSSGLKGSLRVKG